MDPSAAARSARLFPSLVGELLAAAVLLTATAAHAQTARVVVVMDPSDGGSDLLALAVSSTPLKQSVGVPVVVLPLRDLTDAMRASRTQENEAIVAPAHVAASALTHGYELVASSGQSVRYVLVGSGMTANVGELKGKRAYFPGQDSLRSYVARGLLAQAGLTPRSLKQVTYGQTSGAGLMSVSGGLAEATIALESEWSEWSKTSPAPTQVLAVSNPLPAGLTAVVRRDTTPAFKKALLQWVTSNDNLFPGTGRMRPAADPAPYEYVASLGIFTPGQLASVTRITARRAFELAAQGAKLVDVRSEKEYRMRHARGAVNAPYGEKSLKAIDFDAKSDQFAGLASFNRNDPIVFMCNGAECWKSYKASQVARDAGFTRVYWLRGGLPEWIDQRLPTEP
jgi:rhodanese-related sulfurtransferase